MSGFRSGRFGLVVAVTLPAAAHHSPAAYDLQATVTVAGTVTEYEWGNPHVYVSVREDGTGRVFVVEAFASTAMKQYGWLPQLLKSGERVAVTGNPGRNAARSVLFLRSLTRGDVVLFDTAVAFAPPAADAPRPVARASSLAGTWSTEIGPSFFQFLGPTMKLPLTAKASAAVAEFQDTVNPGADCVPVPPPVYMILPGFRSIEVRDERVLLRGEDTAVERVVYLGVVPIPAAPGVHGHSVGRWEGQELVVETTNFAAHRIGNGGGVPSGSAKRLRERFALTDSGGLRYSFELEDPEYLTGPVTGTSQWVYRPEMAYVPTPCNAANARRFLAE